MVYSDISVELRKSIAQYFEILRDSLENASKWMENDEVIQRNTAVIEAGISSLSMFGVRAGLITDAEKTANLHRADKFVRQINEVLRARKEHRMCSPKKDFPALLEYISKVLQLKEEFKNEFNEALVAYNQSFAYVSVLKLNGEKPELYCLPDEIGRRLCHLVRNAFANGVIDQKERNQFFSMIEEVRLMNQK